ncbi:MAG: glycoside hydrolase family 9 protein [Spirochaetales bacterium]|nr:glycoside hydrolase family 9 protein [Spirochaetales bacterium]
MKYFIIRFLLVFLCIPVFSLVMIDDFEGIDNWVAIKDSRSLSSFAVTAVKTGEGEGKAGLFKWTLKKGDKYPFAGIICSLRTRKDRYELLRCEGIRFLARGTGSYTVSLVLPGTEKEYNHYQCFFQAPSEWNWIELPFASFSQPWGTKAAWEPEKINALQVLATGSAGQSGELCLDEVSFYLEKERKNREPLFFTSRKPGVNQVGYLPSAEKYFTIISDAAGKDDPFVITDSKRKKVFTGKVSGPLYDDTELSGEKVYRGDFSAFTGTGFFTITINGETSFPFEIGEGIYNLLFRDVFRFFYVSRCGTAVDDKVNGIQHPACHTKDAALVIEGKKGRLKTTGGWHNAGDYGKWTNEAAYSIAWMLWLYELKKTDLAKFNAQIPESGDTVPDILDEARFGLQWLFTMQGDDGAVYHKVDTEPDFPWGLAPEKDPYERFVRDGDRLSTVNAAAYCGVMGLAARVYRDVDAGFAGLCVRKARSAWQWVKDHPDMDQKNSYYPDTQPWNEVLWATGEMLRLTDDGNLRTRFLGLMNTHALTTPYWGDPQIFGYMAVWSNPETDLKLKSAVRQKMEKYCSEKMAVMAGSGYGTPLNKNEYIWGSNINAAATANVFLLAYHMTGKQVYREHALVILNYLLGINALDKCFVAGYGTNSVEHPYHWAYKVYGKVLKGFMPGGPNGNTHLADPFLTAIVKQGTPPAKCYIDGESYACNEGSTDENATMMFLTGFFYNENL